MLRKIRRKKWEYIVRLCAFCLMCALIGIPVLAQEMGGAPQAAYDATPSETAAAQTPRATPSAQAELAPTQTPDAADGPGGEAAQAPEGTPEADCVVPAQATLPPLRLSGLKIGIDPGHQLHANSELEPVSPGGKEKKAKVSSGTAGRYTGVAEHVVNLDVSLQLRDALVAEGAQVYMTREEADVDISNVERAQMMNELEVDLVLRIHCNGVDSSKKNGIGLYVRKTGEQAEACYEAAQAILPAMVEATGAREDGIFKRDIYSGLNWSTVPSVLVEMGYMTNKEEDIKLNDPEYQQKLVQGMVEGIAAYFGR